MHNEIIIYKNGELELPVEVKHDKETVWLRAEEMADLFERDRSVIQRHIKKHIQRKWTWPNFNLCKICTS